MNINRREPTSNVQGRLPVDGYRKQIGKQDVKKSKDDLKETKKQAQAKLSVSSTYKDVALMVVALAVAVTFVYALLYFLLKK